MKESHGEGPASHIGPESCGGTREGAAEALKGVHPGQVLSCEIMLLSGTPTPLSEAEGKTKGGDRSEPPTGSAQSRTLKEDSAFHCTRGNSLQGKVEDVIRVDDTSDAISIIEITRDRGHRVRQTAAILSSLTSTCRWHGIDPQHYLTQLLTNLPPTPISQIGNWPPDHWKLLNPRHRDRSIAHHPSAICRWGRR